MPSKKKGKKGRKKPLTEDEKVKQAEIKALAEKEKLERRKKLTNVFLMLKRDKEFEMLKLNRMKLLDLWRPRLRKLKMEELLEDFKLMQASFDRNYKKKDELVGELENMMKQNDEEYNNAFDMHLHNLDQLIDWYKNRSREVIAMYDDAEANLALVMDDEEHQMENLQKRGTGYLENAIEGVDQIYRTFDAEANGEMYVREEEIRNRANEGIEHHRRATDKKMKNTWQEIQDMLMQYERKMTPLREQFQKVMAKDHKIIAEINSQVVEMDEHEASVGVLVEKDKAHLETLHVLIDELAITLAELRDEVKAKREEAAAQVAEEVLNLRNLAVVCTFVNERVDRVVKKRERLMRVIERSRKLERWDEKVDPFRKRLGMQEQVTPIFIANVDPELRPNLYTPYKPSSTEMVDGMDINPKEIEHVLTCTCTACSCMVDDEEDTGEVTFDSDKWIQKCFEDHSRLEVFWSRYNGAALESRLMGHQQVAMQKDNNELKLAVRHYMGGINPLEHTNETTFSNELLAASKRHYDIFVRAMVREWKRKERCRKVGGIRVH